LTQNQALINGLRRGNQALNSSLCGGVQQKMSRNMNALCLLRFVFGKGNYSDMIAFGLREGFNRAKISSKAIFERPEKGIL
jgi:hypothetical protein